MLPALTWGITSTRLKVSWKTTDQYGFQKSTLFPSLYMETGHVLCFAELERLQFRHGSNRIQHCASYGP